MIRNPEISSAAAYLLRRMLAAAGYRATRRCAFRQGRTPDLDRLDNRPDETLFVEAGKPFNRQMNGANEPDGAAAD